MKSRADLIRAAIGMLYEAFPGEQATDDDIATVGGLIDGKFAELARRQVFYVQDADAIDDEVFLPLARIIANAAAPFYHLPFSPDVDAREEWRLRNIDRRPDHYDPMVGCYI